MQHMLQGGFTVEQLQRWGHSMVQHGNTLYVFGGYGGASAHRRLNDLIAIDTSTGSACKPTITGMQLTYCKLLRKEGIHQARL